MPRKRKEKKLAPDAKLIRIDSDAVGEIVGMAEERCTSSNLGDCTRREFESFLCIASILYLAEASSESDPKVVFLVIDENVQTDQEKSVLRFLRRLSKSSPFSMIWGVPGDVLDQFSSIQSQNLSLAIIEEVLIRINNTRSTGSIEKLSRIARKSGFLRWFRSFFTPENTLRILEKQLSVPEVVTEDRFA